MHTFRLWVAIQHRMIFIFFNHLQIVFLSWTIACSYVQGDIHILWWPSVLFCSLRKFPHALCNSGPRKTAQTCVILKLIIFFTLKCSLLSVLCAGFLVVSLRYLWSSPSPSMEVIPEEQFLPCGGERYDHCAPLEPTRYKLVIIKLQKWIPNTASLSALTFLQCSTQLPRFSSGKWNTNTGNNVACWEEEPGSKLVCLSLHMASWRPAMQYHREFITSLAEPERRILAMQ